MTAAPVEAPATSMAIAEMVMAVPVTVAAEDVPPRRRRPPGVAVDAGDEAVE